MAAHLEITSMIQMTETRYYEDLSYESVLAALEWTPPGSPGFEPHVRYLAFHIEMLIGEATFLALSPAILKAVVESHCLNASPKTFAQLTTLIGGDQRIYRRSFGRMKASDYVAFVLNEKIDLNEHRSDFIELVKGCRTTHEQAAEAPPFASESSEDLLELSIDDARNDFS
jgi:hypothetical protein